MQLRGRAGAAHWECGSSSRGVLGWWILTMNSHGVEISIAGCVEKIVYNSNLIPCLFFFSFFLSCALY